MTGPQIRIQRPDGGEILTGPEVVVGRSPAAAIRIDDPRVSTVHAELSWRAAGFVLIARGGRLTVGGRPVAEVTLTAGVVVTLAPGVALTVIDVQPGDAPVVPPTAGRERLRFDVGEGLVRVVGPGGVVLAELGGIPGALFAALLGSDGPVPWERIAEGLWPEEGELRAATAAKQGPRAGAWTEIDERRYRNRFDQHLAALRRSLEGVRCGGLIRVTRGSVEVVRQPGDQVVAAT